MTATEHRGPLGRAEILVHLAQSGLDVVVAPHETILTAVRRMGIAVTGGCLAGTCGVCETRVLDGVPLHRDQIIDRAGPDRLKSMMICCSRAATRHLTLDL